MRIAAALPMASTDPNPSKRKLHCVHLAGQRVSVSDSYRAAIMKVEADLPDVLIPAATLAMILRQADAIDIIADERSATVLTADHATSWRIPLVVDDYPDIEKHLMRNESPHSMRFDSEALRDALLRCDAFSDKDVHTVTLTPDGDALTLSMTQDHGTITEAVPLLDGDFESPVSYNAGFLASVVEAAGEERVKLELVDPMKPVIVRGTRIAMLLMPVRSGVKP
jgi:DNA polymerase III sliding clamp (beta) subunit (PCNA family)